MKCWAALPKPRDCLGSSPLKYVRAALPQMTFFFTDKHPPSLPCHRRFSDRAEIDHLLVSDVIAEL
jgi:hypothetical protein